MNFIESGGRSETPKGNGAWEARGENESVVENSIAEESRRKKRGRVAASEGENRRRRRRRRQHGRGGR